MPTAGARFGERSWQLPIAGGQTLACDFADVCNIGGSAAGASVAAAFLSLWIDSRVDWVHVDIAGPVIGGAGVPYAAMLAAWASSQ